MRKVLPFFLLAFTLAALLPAASADIPPSVTVGPVTQEQGTSQPGVTTSVCHLAGCDSGEIPATSIPAEGSQCVLVICTPPVGPVPLTPAIPICAPNDVRALLCTFVTVPGVGVGVGAVGVGGDVTGIGQMGTINPIPIPVVGGTICPANSNPPCNFPLLPSGATFGYVYVSVTALGTSQTVGVGLDGL